MMVDSLIKALILANHKVFIKIIGPKDQEKCLTSIKWEEDEQNVLLFCKAK